MPSKVCTRELPVCPSLPAGGARLTPIPLPHPPGSSCHAERAPNTNSWPCSLMHCRIISITEMTQKCSNDDGSMLSIFNPSLISTSPAHVSTSKTYSARDQLTPCFIAKARQNPAQARFTLPSTPPPQQRTFSQRSSPQARRGSRSPPSSYLPVCQAASPCAHTRAPFPPLPRAPSTRGVARKNLPSLV